MSKKYLMVLALTLIPGALPAAENVVLKCALSKITKDGTEIVKEADLNVGYDIYSDRLSDDAGPGIGKVEAGVYQMVSPGLFGVHIAVTSGSKIKQIINFENSTRQIFVEFTLTSKVGYQLSCQ